MPFAGRLHGLAETRGPTRPAASACGYSLGGLSFSCWSFVVFCGSGFGTRCPGIWLQRRYRKNSIITSKQASAANMDFTSPCSRIYTRLRSQPLQIWACCSGSMPGGGPWAGVATPARALAAFPPQASGNEHNGNDHHGQDDYRFPHSYTPSPRARPPW